VTLSGWVVVAGLLAGLGLSLLLRELLPSAPRLDAAVNRLDAPAAAPAPGPAVPAGWPSRESTATSASRSGIAVATRPWTKSSSTRTPSTTFLQSSSPTLREVATSSSPSQGEA